MDLLEYWPTIEHIKECIRTEAEVRGKGQGLA